MKEAYLCYKKVIQLLAAYVEIHKKDGEKLTVIIKYLDVIRKSLFSRTIQNLYSHYENTNIVEIQKLKWMFFKEMYETLPLNLLSIFPDLEEVISSYFDIELTCFEYYQLNKEKHPKSVRLFEDHFKKQRETKDGLLFLAKYYNSISLSACRVENTVTERIISLKFKAVMNLSILKHLLKYDQYMYRPDFPLRLYEIIEIF
ncbi:MAG: hypothetical protein LIP05_01245 [Tannerellaceae bacterium]|nr:hypothetical protein [Tannerellaceae bacterium]